MDTTFKLNFKFTKVYQTLNNVWEYLTSEEVWLLQQYLCVKNGIRLAPTDRNFIDTEYKLIVSIPSLLTQAFFKFIFWILWSKPLVIPVKKFFELMLRDCSLQVSPLPPKKRHFSNHKYSNHKLISNTFFLTYFSDCWQKNFFPKTFSKVCFERN